MTAHTLALRYVELASNATTDKGDIPIFQLSLAISNALPPVVLFELVTQDWKIGMSPLLVVRWAGPGIRLERLAL